MVLFQNSRLGILLNGPQLDAWLDAFFRDHLLHSIVWSFVKVSLEDIPSVFVYLKMSQFLSHF